MVKFFLALTLCLFLETYLYCIDRYGYNHHSVVYVQMTDSLAYAEYCYSDLKGLVHTKFDSLKITKNSQYEGNFSVIRSINGKLIFKPGNIALKPGVPDTSFNKMRNQGFLDFKSNQFTRKFQWVGLGQNSFYIATWNGRELYYLNPASYQKAATLAFDSLSNFYTSKAFTSRFNKVIIVNSRIFSRKLLESRENEEIFKLWKQLSGGKPEKRNSTGNFIQFLVILPVSAIYFKKEYLYIPAAILAYPIIIFAEERVIDLINAKNTYKIIFYGIDGSKTKLKIRNSKIISENYKYLLRSVFIMH
jgi:hypothetical protein